MMNSLKVSTKLLKKFSGNLISVCCDHCGTFYYIAWSHNSNIFKKCSNDGTEQGLLNLGNPKLLVYDPKRRVIYISTEIRHILEYNVATGDIETFIGPYDNSYIQHHFDIGGPNWMDVYDDYFYFYDRKFYKVHIPSKTVTELELSDVNQYGTHFWIQHIHLNTITLDKDTIWFRKDFRFMKFNTHEKMPIKVYKTDNLKFEIEHSNAIVLPNLFKWNNHFYESTSLGIKKWTNEKWEWIIRFEKESVLQCFFIKYQTLKLCIAFKGEAYEIDSLWTVVRLLWIAKLKNDSNCLITLLPKEIVKEIQKFIIKK
jgi:hypothetical protein